MSADPIVGYSDLQEDGGRVFGTAHYASGRSERSEVRLVIESQITRAGGKVEPVREVASTDAGTVRVADGASL